MSRITWRHIARAAIAAVGVALAVGVIMLATPLADHVRSADAPTTPVALPAAAIVATTPASADDRMNQYLDEHGNPQDQHDQARYTARAVCDHLGWGDDYDTTLQWVEMHATMTPHVASVFTNTAIDIYCPVYDYMRPLH